MDIIANPTKGDRLDATATMYPSYLEVVSGAWRLSEEAATHYGYVLSGSTKLIGEYSK